MIRRPIWAGRISMSLFAALYGLSLFLWAAIETNGGLVALMTAVIGVMQTVLYQRNEKKRQDEEKKRKEEHERLIRMAREKRDLRRKYAQQHRVLRSALERAEKAEAEFVELMDTLVGERILPGGNPAERGDDR